MPDARSSRSEGRKRIANPHAARAPGRVLPTAPRIKNDLSMLDVARELGISDSYVSQIENGRANPPKDEMLDNFLNLYYDDPENEYIILKNNCLLEFDDSYCEILHDGKQDAFIQELTDLVNLFKERQRKQPQEINLIVKTGRGLDLKAMEIKRTKLAIDLFYESDFA